MYIVRMYTTHPNTPDEKEIKAVRYIDKNSALDIARAGSKVGYYMTVKLDEGELIAAFSEGNQVKE